MKLSTKIILPVAIVIVIGMGVLLLRMYQMGADSLQTSVEAMEQMAVENILYEIRKTHEGDESAVMTLALMESLQGFLLDGEEGREAYAPQVNYFLKEYVKAYNYAVSGIARVDGTIVASTDRSHLGTSLAGHTFFQKVATSHTHAVSTPYLLNNEAAVTIGATIVKQGTNEIIGVAYNVIYQYLDTSAVMKALGTHGKVMISNREGLIFTHSNPQYEFKIELSKTDWGQEIVAKKHGIVHFEEGGEPMTAAYTNYEHLGWIAIAVTNNNEIKAPSIAMGKAGIVYSIVITFVILAILVFFVTRVARSLRLGVVYAQEVARGNMQAKLSVHSRDETGELADALRSIPEVINHVIEEYSQLEKSVRTGSLLSRVDSKGFQGDFAKLISGTNDILAKYTAVIDNIPSPVVVLNNKLEAGYLNKVAIDLTTPSYHGKKCVELFNREDDATPNDGLLAALRTKAPSGGETVAHPIGGGRFDVAYNAIPLFDDKGQVISVLQLITDVTSFKATQNTIMHVAETATTISTQVATAAEELSAQLQTSEESATMQANRVSGAANTMATMNATVVAMAVNAKEASEVSSTAKVEAENGAQVVQKAVTSIQTVQDQSHKLKTGMEQLNINANAINEVITTISDIADQTNLLALNAAIEAARAGESGRGFAVVADEVRKLAEKTMTSTTEVRNAITAIQQSVNESVKLVDDSVKAVEQTSELVTESGDVFLSIVHMVEKTAEKSQIIASASDEQAHNSEIINGALSEVNLLASETAHGMKEATLAVTDLSAQSQNLLELIADMQKA